VYIGLMSENVKKYSSLNVFTRLLKYAWSKWYLLILGIVFIIIVSYIDSLIPVLIRETIDEGIVNRNFDAILKYSLFIISIVLVEGGFSFISRMCFVKLSQETVYRIRMDSFKSIQRQSMDFFDRAIIGQLISRITNDAERLSEFLSWRLRMLIYSFMLIALSLFFMFSMNYFLAVISFITISICIVLNTRFAILIRPVQDAIRQQIGVLAGLTASDLAGVKTVKSLAIEENEYSRFVNENNKFLDLNIKAAKMRAIYGNASFLVIGLTMASIVYFGGQAIMNNILTIGELSAFLTYLITLSWPMRGLGFIISDIQRSVASAYRLFEIIDSEPRVRERENAIELNNVRGEIVFENVSFSYSSGKKILDKISFHVKPGEKIVIVGPPGSGKSTILKLIMRFYDPDEGRILIDGVDIRDLKLSYLRKIVSYIQQEPFIFNRSIRENIMLGNPDASFDNIVKAARIAKIHDFIEILPNKYDTVVGERGVMLSGGQRQRIAIARALVSNPKILLLDDPVSNLDAETERELVNDLRDIIRDKTAIIVTQRLSLIELADRIIVVNNGRIVEMGTHDELIKRRGLYYQLYKSYGGIVDE